MKSLHHLAVAAGVFALAAMPVKADLLTAPAQLPSAPINLLFTFDTPAGSNLLAPVAIGNGVTFSTTGGPGSLGGAEFGAWSLGSNGFWSGGKTFAGVDGDFDVNGQPAGMLFDFGGLLVKGVGGVMNFDPDFTFGGPTFAFPLPLYIAAFDKSGTLLEEYELPLINTSNGFNEGVFYGIGRDQADIASFLISGPYAVVDDLQIAAIPLPPTAWLMGAGMVLLGWQARRRKA
jgi:hypothetical protein